MATTAGPDANNPAGTFTDKGGNLIGISGAGSGNTGFTASTTQKGTVANPLDPLLGPLQDNGGPKIGAPGTRITLETEAPLSGSSIRLYYRSPDCASSGPSTWCAARAGATDRPCKPSAASWGR